MTEHGDTEPIEEARKRAGANSGGDQPWHHRPKLRPIAWPEGPVPPRRWLVDGLIPHRTVTMLGGDGGLGKSLLAQMLLTAAATGKMWLGKQTKECKAVGLFCEDDDDELRRRQSAINAHLGIEFGDLENLSVICCVGEDNVLMEFDRYEGRGTETHFFGQAMNFADDFGAELVVLDSLHDLFAGNENSRPQARQFVNALRRIAMEIDGAVVLTAHPSLSGLNTGSGLSGSTAWNNAVRSRLYLERLKDDDSEDDVRVLRTVKSNYGPAGGEIRMRWREGVFVHDEPLGGLLGSIERGSVERDFIAALAAAVNEGFEPALSISARGAYAPKLLLGRPEVRGHSVRDLERGMKSALTSGLLVVGLTEGPESRRKKILVPAGHRLASSAENPDAI